VADDAPNAELMLFEDGTASANNMPNRPRHRLPTGCASVGPMSSGQVARCSPWAGERPTYPPGVSCRWLST
jgi:hypothetical protein